MAGHFGVLHEVWAVWHAVVDARRRETSTAQSKRVVVVVAFDAVTSCSGLGVSSRARAGATIAPPSASTRAAAPACNECNRQCERESRDREVREAIVGSRRGALVVSRAPCTHIETRFESGFPGRGTRRGTVHRLTPGARCWWPVTVRTRRTPQSQEAR